MSLVARLRTIDIGIHDTARPALGDRTVAVWDSTPEVELIIDPTHFTMPRGDDDFMLMEQYTQQRDARVARVLDGGSTDDVKYGAVRIRRHTDGRTVHDFKERLSTTPIVPGMVLAVSDEHPTHANHLMFDRPGYDVKVYCCAMQLPGYGSIVLLRYEHGTTTRYEVEFDTVGRAMQTVYPLCLALKYHPTISACIGAPKAKSIISSSVRPTDRVMGPVRSKSPVIYLPKVNGVRRILIWVCGVWMSFNPLRKYDPGHVVPFTSLAGRDCDVNWALDVEEVDAGYYVLGVLQPSYTECGVKWVGSCTARQSSPMAEIQHAAVAYDNIAGIPLLRRPYFTDFALAIAHVERQGEDKCDGIVAVVSNIIQLKMKMKPTVELMVQDSGDGVMRMVCSAESDTINPVIDWAAVPDNAMVDDVYEYWVQDVSLDMHRQVVSVTAVCLKPRPDKAKPSASAVVKSVVDVVAGIDGGVVPQLLRVSARLRLRVHETLCAHKPMTVIDVGSDQGCSIDAMKNFGLRTLFVEPDPDFMQLHATKLGRPTMTKDDAKQAVAWVRSRRGMARSINCRLEDLFEAGLGKIKDMTIAYCCTYSLNYVLGAIVAEVANPKVYGCLYVYDGIPDGGYLIRTADVTMGPRRGNMSPVVWKSKAYVEPVYTERMITGMLPRHRVQTFDDATDVLDEDCDVLLRSHRWVSPVAAT